MCCSLVVSYVCVVWWKSTPCALKMQAVVPLKRWYLCTKLYGVTFQKAASFKVASARSLSERLIMGLLWDLSLASEGCTFEHTFGIRVCGFSTTCTGFHCD
jgi:hypothetical protein